MHQNEGGNPRRMRQTRRIASIMILVHCAFDKFPRHNLVRNQSSITNLHFYYVSKSNPKQIVENFTDHIWVLIPNLLFDILFNMSLNTKIQPYELFSAII